MGRFSLLMLFLLTMVSSPYYVAAASSGSGGSKAVGGSTGGSGGGAGGGSQPGGGTPGGGMSTGGQCSNVFPNALSTYGDSGNIDFGYNSYVYHSSGNSLSTASVTKNGGSTQPTCSTTDCIANPGVTGVESIDPGSFQISGSSKDESLAYQEAKTLGSSTNRYRNISTNSDATLTFSSKQTEYYITSLSMGYRSTLYLQGGTTYWIERLSFNSEVKVVIQGSGTARILVNNNLSIGSPGFINSSGINVEGDASKLFLYVNGTFTTNNHATVSAVIYCTGDASIGSASYVYGALTAKNVSLGTDSTVTFQSSNVNSVDYGDLCSSSVSSIDHYQIEMDGVGLTCESEDIVIRACLDADCSEESTSVSTITLSPSGLAESDTISFTGSTTVSLSHTTAETVTLSLSDTDPVGELECVNGSAETCDLTFADAGFEFINSSTGDSSLPDQLAETYFSNVSLRAVYDNNGVCAALLQGSQQVTLGYQCDSPSSCQSALQPISSAVKSNGASKKLNLTFDSDGVASLDSLYFPDAGQLTLYASATVDRANIESGNASINVVPAQIELSVSSSALTDSTSTWQAGDDFTLTVSALGNNGGLLPNYQPGQLQWSLMRLLPSTDGVEGTLDYASGDSVVSSLAGGFVDSASLGFSDGEYVYAQARYSEVGRVNLAVQDANYLGASIAGNDLTLGRFIPAYFSVELQQTPQLLPACGTFTYLDQPLSFDTSYPAKISLTAKNAEGDITYNYGNDFWNLSVSDASMTASLGYADSSSYTSYGDASVISLGDSPQLSGDDDYDGSGVITIANAQFTYNKADSAGTAYTPVVPFQASVDMTFGADMLTDSDGVCYKSTATDTSCLNFVISNISGSVMRYGRLNLTSVYGPESESLWVPMTAEYLNSAGKWVTNGDDYCTDISMTYADGDVVLTADGETDLTALVGSPSAAGMLSAGLSDSADLVLSSPGAVGSLYLSLYPASAPAWAEYLNIDWNGDGVICSSLAFCSTDALDYPSAQVTFGVYRGNDRILHWRGL